VAEDRRPVEVSERVGAAAGLLVGPVAVGARVGQELEVALRVSSPVEPTPVVLLIDVEWAEELRVVHLEGLDIRRTLPPLATVLADPEFAALRRWLDERGVDVAELERRIDELTAEVRAKALATP
jgi:hypothetical protein